MPIEGKPKTNRFNSSQTLGFIACYKGQTIASARSFDLLAQKAEVLALLGNKDFIIKHTVPEGMLAVY
ncbi:hypothetical protein ACFLWZ_07325 [Chloroflexota bacterium]